MYARETLGDMAAVKYVGIDSVLLGSTARGPTGACMPAEWTVSSSKMYPDTTAV
jgi:hypothetical protein